MPSYAQNSKNYQRMVDYSRSEHVTKPGTFEVVEGDNRLSISFDYSEESVALIRAIPGAQRDWQTRKWSVSTRYRKRFDDAARKIELIVTQSVRDHQATAEREEAERIATARSLAEDAKANPIAEPKGWRITMVEGRWVVASPYNASTVADLKRIAGAKWTGQAWTFPAGAREALTNIVTAMMTETTDA